MLSLAILTPLIILEAFLSTLALATTSDASATKPLNITEVNYGGSAGNTAGLME